MNTLEKSEENLTMMGPIDRGLRFTIGFVALIVMLNITVATNVAMSFEMLIATLVALSGLIAWDPFYALLQLFGSRKGISGSISTKPANNAA